MAADTSKYRQFAKKPTVPADDASLGRASTHRDDNNAPTSFSCTSLYRKLQTPGTALDTTVWDANAPAMVQESRDIMRRSQVSKGASASLTQSVPLRTRALDLMDGAHGTFRPHDEAALDVVVKGSMRSSADASDDEPLSGRRASPDDTLASLMSPKTTRGLRALYSHEVPSIAGAASRLDSPVSLSRYLADRHPVGRRSGNFSVQSSLQSSRSGSPTSPTRHVDSPEFVGRRADFANTRKFEMVLRTAQKQNRTADKQVTGTLGRLMQTVTSDPSYMRGMRRRERQASDLGFGRALDLPGSDTRRPPSPEMHEPPPLYVEEDTGPGEVAVASARARRLSPPNPFHDKGESGSAPPWPPRNSAAHMAARSSSLHAPPRVAFTANPPRVKQKRDFAAPRASSAADQAQLGQSRLRSAEAMARRTRQAQDMARAARERGAAGRAALGVADSSSLRETGATPTTHGGKGWSGGADKAQSQLRGGHTHDRATAAKTRPVVVQIKNVDVSAPETLEYLTCVSAQLKQMGMTVAFTKSVDTASLASPVLVLTEEDAEARMVTLHNGSGSAAYRPLENALEDLHNHRPYAAKFGGAAAKRDEADNGEAKEVGAETVEAQEQAEESRKAAQLEADDREVDKGKHQDAKAKATDAETTQVGGPQGKVQNESARERTSQARRDEARSVAAKSIVRDAEDMLAAVTGTRAEAEAQRSPRDEGKSKSAGASKRTVRASVPCRYGARCRNARCGFKHPESWDPKNLLKGKSKCFESKHNGPQSKSPQQDGTNGGKEKTFSHPSRQVRGTPSTVSKKSPDAKAKARPNKTNRAKAGRAQKADTGKRNANG